MPLPDIGRAKSLPAGGNDSTAGRYFQGARLVLNVIAGREPKLVRYDKCLMGCGWCRKNHTLTPGRIYKVICVRAQYSWVRVKNDRGDILEYSKKHFEEAFEIDLPMST